MLHCLKTPCSSLHDLKDLFKHFCAVVSSNKLDFAPTYIANFTMPAVIYKLLRVMQNVDS